MDEAKKRSVTLHPGRKQLAESARNLWVANAEAGTTIQDVLQTAYWAHVASELRTYDHIEVRLETGEWVAELLVVSQGLNWAKVHMLHFHDLNGASEAPPDSQLHEVKWRGPQHKFCVVRLSDSAVLQAGMEKEQAYAWMKAHERTVAMT